VPEPEVENQAKFSKVYPLPLKIRGGCAKIWVRISSSAEDTASDILVVRPLRVCAGRLDTIYWAVFHEGNITMPIFHSWG